MGNTLCRLKGGVALVTGGRKGLGKAMARGFVEAGADVFISSRHQAELETAAAEIASGWESRVAWAVSDQTNRRDAGRLVDAAIEKFGQIDILVNKAGSNTPQPIDQIKDDDWDRIIELNLNSCMALSRAVAPQMKERRWGRIIHISSIMGLPSPSGSDAHSAATPALILLTPA